MKDAFVKKATPETAVRKVTGNCKIEKHWIDTF